MTRAPARIDLALRLAPYSPAAGSPVPRAGLRRRPTPVASAPAAAGQRVSLGAGRALARRRAPLTWRRGAARWLRDFPWSLLDALGRLVRACWPAVAALALVVLMAGASVSIAVTPVVAR